MNAVSSMELRPFPVRTALVVGGDSETEARLRDILEPNTWAMQRAPDNATALLMAQKKGFDLILTSEKTSGKRTSNCCARFEASVLIPA